MSIYKLIENNKTQTFEGFRPAFKCIPRLQPNEKLIAVHWDGEYDLWIIESNAGMEELQRFYRMAHGFDITCRESQVVQIQSFQREN